MEPHEITSQIAVLTNTLSVFHAMYGNESMSKESIEKIEAKIMALVEKL